MSPPHYNNAEKDGGLVIFYFGIHVCKGAECINQYGSYRIM